MRKKENGATFALENFYQKFERKKKNLDTWGG
jgi:hypothetical protein